MTKNIKIESGMQLLARLTKKHDSFNIYPALFEESLKTTSVIELTGENNCGKTTLLCNFICHTLLPVKYNGLGAGALFFSTDGNFCLGVIISIIEQKLKAYEDLQHEVDNIILNIFNNLFLVEIFDSDQFQTTIENMENILIENKIISLIVFDTLTAFYWSEQQVRLTKMEYYIIKLLETIKKHIKIHQVPLIYTKPLYFANIPVSECRLDNNVEHIDYRISISTYTFTDNIHWFKVCKQSHTSCIIKYFYISNDTIIWK